MKYLVEILSWVQHDGTWHCTVDSTEEFEDLEVAKDFVEAFNAEEPYPKDTWYLWATGPFKSSMYK
jgi:hypothetical protein